MDPFQSALDKITEYRQRFGSHLGGSLPHLTPAQRTILVELEVAKFVVDTFGPLAEQISETGVSATDRAEG